MHIFLPLLNILFLFTLVVGCGGPQKADTAMDAKPLVVATTTQLSDLARQIGGDHIEVVSLMKPGVDPHSYQASAQDITNLHSADFVLFHGLSLEGKIARVLENVKMKGKFHFSPCVALPKEQLIQGEDTSAPIDPHLWFSPDLWIQCGHLLSQKFSEFLPQNQESFASNFLQFKQSVKELDHWGKALVGGLPETSRTLITSHDAFRYFGRHFDIRVVALQGINTIAEAGLADRTNLVDFIRKHHSPALFVESSVNPKALKEIARETGSVIGGTLFSDALGSDSQFAQGPKGENLPTSTWQGMMAHNLRTIEKALQKTQ